MIRAVVPAVAALVPTEEIMDLVMRVMVPSV